MSSRSNCNYPNEGSKTTFKVIFPKQDAAEDSSSIDNPYKIISDFAALAEPFHFHKFLVNHLLELVANGYFETFTEKGLNEFVYPYQAISDTIYALEQHSADQSLKFHILHFLELVMGKDKEEVEEAKQAIDQLVDRYGSLTNGLHHFTHGHRA